MLVGRANSSRVPHVSPASSWIHMTRRAQPPTSLRWSHHQASRAPSKILSCFVDDDRSLASSPKEFLACDSYSVLYSENGREALEILRACRFSPKQILLDLMMPVLDGWGFLLESRKDPRLLEIPIVMMTGTNGVARTATAGAKAIVHNPSRLRIFYPSSSSFRRRIAIIVNLNSRGSVAPIGAAARRAELGIVDRSAPASACRRIRRPTFRQPSAAQRTR